MFWVSLCPDLGVLVAPFISLFHRQNALIRARLSFTLSLRISRFDCVFLLFLCAPLCTVRRYLIACDSGTLNERMRSNGGEREIEQEARLGYECMSGNGEHVEYSSRRKQKKIEHTKNKASDNDTRHQGTRNVVGTGFLFSLFRVYRQFIGRDSIG